MQPSRAIIETVFWSKVKKGRSCWEWQGELNYKGYGLFRKTRSHRFSYELAKGKIPKSKIIMHICDNRKCIRPSHLKAGTIAENQADMKAKKRGRNNGPRGQDHGYTNFTDEDVTDIRKRYAAGSLSQRSLAREYGVTQACISLIVRRIHWRHI